MKENTTAKKPSLVQAIVLLVCVIGIVVYAIRISAGIQIALTLGATVAIIGALLLKQKWADIQKNIISVVGDSAPTLLILISVGMLVGIWIIGGTVPALLYYGLKLCSPAIIVPLTFVLCGITSLFTGTSFGSIATMGLAFYGVGLGMGIPAPLMAGAVCAGAFFGDKMSPLSDTTNVAAVMSGTDLYDHIGSMLRTTVPASLIALVIYAVLGLKYAGGAVNMDDINLMMETLDNAFHITPIALLPALLVLVVSAKKAPAVPALLGCTLVSAVFAFVLQDGLTIPAVLGAAMNGYTSETGVALVDTILSRGGISMMYGTVAVIIMSSTMGAAMETSGIISVLVEDGLLKTVKKPRGLILSTMLFCYVLLAISGHQVMPIILGGRTFKPAFDKMNIQSKVLSRTLEDTATIGAPLVPWSTSAVYMMSVLGCTTAYIPYAFMNYIVPVFSIVYACTGLFIWKKTAAEEETA